MTIIIANVKTKYDGHRTLVVTYHRPAWVWRVLFRVKDKNVNYVGYGTKWVTYPEMDPVESKRLVAELGKAAERHRIFKESLKHKRQ